MRKLTALLLLLLCCGAHAQGDNTLLIKAGKSIRESIADTDLYEYPKFVQGSVLSRDGSQSGGLLNYNKLLDEMQFVDAKGDTLSLDQEGAIRHVVVGSDTFFYDRGYVKLLKGNSTAKLARKQVLSIADKQKQGGYGTSTSTSAIANYSSYNDGARFYNLTVMVDIVLVKQVQYYFGDKNNRFALANRKHLFTLFPKQQSALKTYLKEHPVDFNNPNDLEKLILFTGSL